MTVREWERVNYDSLNAKQKEIYNFQKIAALLADYGFNCIKLADDWNGADFVAVHKDGDTVLKAQLKARCLIAKRYMGKDLWMAFPIENHWYIVPHDELLDVIRETTGALETRSWVEGGEYNWPRPSKPMREMFEDFRL